jgi:hypothetical protein
MSTSTRWDLHAYGRYIKYNHHGVIFESSPDGDLIGSSLSVGATNLRLVGKLNLYYLSLCRFATDREINEKYPKVGLSSPIQKSEFPCPTLNKGCTALPLRTCPDKARVHVCHERESFCFNQGRSFLARLGFSIHGCLSRPEIADFRGLGGPGGPKNHYRRWGAKAPTFGYCFWGRRGRPDPKNQRLPAGPKTMYYKPKGRPVFVLFARARECRACMPSADRRGD